MKRRGKAEAVAGRCVGQRRGEREGKGGDPGREWREAAGQSYSALPKQGSLRGRGVEQCVPSEHQ